MTPEQEKFITNISKKEIWKERLFNLLGFCLSCFIMGWTLLAGVPALWFAIQTYFWWLIMPLKKKAEKDDDSFFDGAASV